MEEVTRAKSGAEAKPPHIFTTDVAKTHNVTMVWILLCRQYLKTSLILLRFAQNLTRNRTENYD